MPIQRSPHNPGSWHKQQSDLIRNAPAVPFFQSHGLMVLPERPPERPILPVPKSTATVQTAKISTTTTTATTPTATTTETNQY